MLNSSNRKLDAPSSLRPSRGSNTKGKGKSSLLVGRSSSRRSTPSNQHKRRILFETNQFTVEDVGTLPVQLSERLTAMRGSENVTGRITPSGWSYIIFKNNLFVWKQSVIDKQATNLCHQFPLAPTNYSYSANLISILTVDTENSVSIVAVSPDGLVSSNSKSTFIGIVRYWPNFMQQATYFEMKIVEIGENDCCFMTVINPFGCILSTKSSKLFLLQPSSVGMKLNVTYQELRKSVGLFAGIGRRISSFFTSSDDSVSLVKSQILDGFQSNKDNCTFYTIANSRLFTWRISYDGTERIIDECDLYQMFANGPAKEILSTFSDTDRSNIYFTDISKYRSGLLVLVHITSTVNGISYEDGLALFRIILKDDVPYDCNIVSTLQLSENAPKPVSSEDNEWTLHISTGNAGEFVFIRTIDDIYYLFESNIIPVVNLSRYELILGSGTINGVLLYITSRGAVNALFPKATSLISLTSSKHENASKHPNVETSIKYKGDYSSILNDTEGDMPGILRAAFIQYTGDDFDTAEQICNDIFPTTVGPVLDNSIIEVSRKLIDEPPSADPRWAHSLTPEGTSTSSVIIIHQLEDKLRTHSHYLEFLSNLNLLSRVTVCNVNDRKISTLRSLCEHAEKVCAAVALRSLHIKNPELIDTVIKLIMQDRGLKSSVILTWQDLFYKDVSMIDDVLPYLVNYEMEMCQSQLKQPEKIGQLVDDISFIITEVLQDALRCRRNFEAKYIQDSSYQQLEYIPWTASTGLKGARTTFLQQHAIIVERVFDQDIGPQIRDSLFTRLVDLTTLILTGYEDQLNSLRFCNNKTRMKEVLESFEKDRCTLIRPLLDGKQTVRAATLAEKFYDFESLVRLCEEDNNKDQLQEYMIQFAQQGFPQFVFQWYLSRGEYRKLLELHDSQDVNLKNFLRSRPNLSWIHDVKIGAFTDASHTLKELAENEKDLLSRKETFLSLSKLSLLASSEENNAMELAGRLKGARRFLSVGLHIFIATNTELDVVNYQMVLPETVVQELFGSPDSMPPLTVPDIIEGFVGDKNEDASEYDFKNALDLLDLRGLDTDGHQKLRLYIWSKAILRDKWTEMESSDPLLVAQETIFFKIIQLGYEQGISLKDFVPTIDELKGSDLLISANLSFNPNFQFLIQAVYEYISQAC
ncbi:Nuclear pore complex protein Nup133 [Trichoplax sp. H2]|nr:Nuclear pore complex protein Nup133 [Trichoplax sp. H2]|eukprot:RDD40881.1 Nuclear pore complex protein Nup133 [Trichoplax sp. H2]